MIGIRYGNWAFSFESSLGAWRANLVIPLHKSSEGCLRSFSEGADVLLGTLNEFAMTQAQNRPNEEALMRVFSNTDMAAAMNPEVAGDVGMNMETSAIGWVNANDDVFNDVRDIAHHVNTNFITVA